MQGVVDPHREVAAHLALVVSAQVRHLLDHRTHGRVGLREIGERVEARGAYVDGVSDVRVVAEPSAKSSSSSSGSESQRIRWTCWATIA